MPYIVRSASPTYTTVVRTGAPEVKSVIFPPSPVTGVSRLPSESEDWAMYRFEMHARECDACYSPYDVQKSNGRLCHFGHELAQDVASYVYTRGDGAQAYSAGEKLIRVEIPANYDRVRSLLRAMERSLRHRRQRPIVSMDRSYPVSERRPRLPVRTPTDIHHHHHHRLVEAPSPPRHQFREAHQVLVESPSRRLSVYPSYATEIRSPGRQPRTEYGYYV